MNFSDKIKYQREQNHLTQKELAELVGVSQRAIAAYESSGTIARISTMRKLAHALNVSYDYLKHDEITDPSYGIEKMDYIDEVNGQLGEKGAKDINEILEANRALFAGGELDEEAKDAFYQAVTKAYLSCKMEAELVKRARREIDRQLKELGLDPQLTTQLPHNYRYPKN